MVDVLITSVPLTYSGRVPAAPGLLISMIEKFGFTGAFYDFNIEVKDDEKINDLAVKNYVSDFDYIDRLMTFHVKKMLEYKPKYIGISVFTFQCVNVTKSLCTYIRMMAPEIKIILGGAGLGITGMNSDSWGPWFEERNLCDYWVKSEGEYAIVDILKGDHKNTGEWNQIMDLDEFPYPNYDSYLWNKYPDDLRWIPITGSRGCVRRCTFCDIHTHWKKFVWRDGKSIANEMIYQQKKYNNNFFYFTDSLINGSMKAYKDFINTLADYNQTADVPIKWGGQFIYRPANQMPDDIWKQSAKAGAYRLGVGIESLSEEAREHMGKKFSNDDIRYGLACQKRYGITTSFMMIVGYFTDTDKSIEEQMKFFTELSKDYTETIHAVSLGTTLGILPGTRLDNPKMQAEFGVIPGTNENNWTGPSTLEQRVAWRLKLAKHCKKLGFKMNHDDEQMLNLTMYIKRDKRENA